MSLPDTAEYWWDVKGYNRKSYYGPDFFHIPGLDCGHNHLYEAKYVDEVNCYACKKALAEGIVHNLKSIEQHQKDDENKKRSKLLNEQTKSKKKHPNNPVCTCGFAMIERTNSKNGNSFYGCSDFPKCKNTKPK